MVVIRTEQSVYPYGTFYDPDKERSPSPNRGGHDIVVYVHTAEENRAIGSLEGIFVCDKPIVLAPRVILPCKREQMNEFEKKYLGKFFPFEE